LGVSVDPVVLCAVGSALKNLGLEGTTRMASFAGAMECGCHSMITAVWHMLSTGEYYRDLGGDYYSCRCPERTIRRKIQDLEAAGYHVIADPRPV
jgi:hypothetical protein